MRARRLTQLGALSSARRAPTGRLADTRCHPGSTQQQRHHASLNTRHGSERTPLDGLPWRVFPSKERLQRIDVLTFLLGRYPRVRDAHNPDEDTTENKDRVEARHEVVMATTASSSSSQSASTPSPSAAGTASSRTVRKGPQSKRRSLDVLQSQSKRATARPVAVTSPATPTNAATARAEAIRPFTPRDEVQQLANAWRTVQALQAHQEALQDAEEAQVRARFLTHPPELFDDESQVIHRFGMGGRTSPASVPGFTALFRQHWSDFHVTEMVPDYDAPSGGRPLSRHYDFTVPSLPPGLTAPSLGAPRASTKTHSERNDSSSDGETHPVEDPDESFFQVDVAQRTSELQRDAATYLSDGGVAEASAHGESTNAIFDALAKQEAHLAEQEAALERMHPSHDGKRSHHHSGHDDATTPASARPGTYHLQCVLHKQHISHSVALANIAQTLRVHPHAISVAGIKDFIGDTVQRVRLERVSPAAALLANRAFRRRGWRMHLSDFSYEATPLSPGDLFGNHFKIVLRDVVAERPSDIEAAMEGFRQYGFPNYYGAQRFSWFGGTEDAGFALLRHNWLAFAFRFLNYTAKDRTLRELLQRPHKYPHAVQDEYRRNVVRRLRQIAVEPEDLDEVPFLGSPSLHEPLTGIDGGPLNQRQDLIVWQLEQAFFDLQPQSRRLTAQRLSSYLWNQALTLRLHHFGSTEVLVGDHVLPAAVRRQMHTLFDRQALTHRYSGVVTDDTKSAFTIADVVHPGFSFDGIRLPDNAVGAYYEQICDKYRLDWYARHSGAGLRDFREPPRPIVRHPINLSYSYNPEKATLTAEFALERGCYANVAVSELMKRARCAGAESIVVLPAAESTWDALGDRDPGYVTSMQDIYEGYEDGLGFTRDEAEVATAKESETKVWDMTGPLFLPDEEDPFRKAHAWGQRHLLSNIERRAADAERLKRQLFEKPLADKLTEDELRQYAGHSIPMSPNMRGKKVFFKVLRRNRRYAGAPKVEPRLRRGASVKNRNHRLPKFRSLNKNAWNVSW